MTFLRKLTKQVVFYFVIKYKWENNGIKFSSHSGVLHFGFCPFWLWIFFYLKENWGNRQLATSKNDIPINIWPVRRYCVEADLKKNSVFHGFGWSASKPGEPVTWCFTCMQRWHSSSVMVNHWDEWGQHTGSETKGNVLSTKQELWVEKQWAVGEDKKICILIFYSPSLDSEERVH